MEGSVILAVLPLLTVVALMLLLRQSSARAALIALSVAAVMGVGSYGLNLPVFLVSQARGLALSFYILYIIWTALLLYQVVGEVGGIAALDALTSAWVPDRAAAALLFAWCLSGLLEGIAGFGVPLAVVAPLLVGLGVAPVTAVAATAMGHAWSVTFGDMGVVYQALLAVVSVPEGAITPAATAILGGVCIASGLIVALMLGLRGTPVLARVALVGAVMSLVQASLAITGLAPLAAFGAGVAGMAAGAVLFGDRRVAAPVPRRHRAGLVALGAYGLVAGLLALPSLSRRLAVALSHPVTSLDLPEVTTGAGWVTAAGTTKPVAWLLHPGTAMLVVLVPLAVLYLLRGRLSSAALRRCWSRTWKVAAPTSVGVTAMVGLAMLMDHTGMTQQLAAAIGRAGGRAYPLLVALVGLLGAFATGSNTSSNVLFGPLQEEMATMLRLSPAWLLAAQTAGGALGSMVAPAKLVLGCASVGLAGRESEVLRRTGHVALGVALLVGFVTLALA